jgi:hypothetical protein
MATKVHKVWSTKHYNAISKEIREQFPVEGTLHDQQVHRGVLVSLALSLCKRFKQDSDEATAGFDFDPIKFLDACSPNPDLYPLSELWEGDQLG